MPHGGAATDGASFNIGGGAAQRMLAAPRSVEWCEARFGRHEVESRSQRETVRYSLDGDGFLAALADMGLAT